jgi:hypothetical protein
VADGLRLSHQQTTDLVHNNQLSEEADMTMICILAPGATLKMTMRALRHHRQQMLRSYYVLQFLIISR